jgi:hypothetical protein
MRSSVNKLDHFDGGTLDRRGRRLLEGSLAGLQFLQQSRRAHCSRLGQHRHLAMDIGPWLEAMLHRRLHFVDRGTQTGRSRWMRLGDSGVVKVGHLP